MTEHKAIEVGSLVRHKCGGPILYVFDIAFQGNCGCTYWDEVSGSFHDRFFTPGELEPVSNILDHPPKGFIRTPGGWRTVE